MSWVVHNLYSMAYRVLSVMPKRLQIIIICSFVKPLVADYNYMQLCKATGKVHIRISNELIHALQKAIHIRAL